MAPAELIHANGRVQISHEQSGRLRISVQPASNTVYIKDRSCVTSYPPELIELILQTVGLGYLCDEIQRDEEPSYVQETLAVELMAYVSKDSFSNCRILDFGCGSGASTMALCRLFPSAKVVGLELKEKYLSVARARAKHYGFAGVTFVHSVDAGCIPAGLGQFNYILLSEVFEHLLPSERRTLLPLLWRLLLPGGVLFINGTPNIRFPIETHTTGLPLINYLPDTIALEYAQWFSRRGLRNASWEDLLRAGIRGASEQELVAGLEGDGGKPPIILEPSELGCADKIDVWYAARHNVGRFANSKILYKTFLKLAKPVLGYALVPYLSIALKKA
jgi:2-polyprenyl-3-methyl-5-hydroxy-6-metoxy-1,4-benzoquinol methylase